MSLEALNESNLRALQRHYEEQIEKRRNALEIAAKNGDHTKVVVLAGNIEELRAQMAQAEAQIRRDQA